MSVTRAYHPVRMDSLESRLFLSAARPTATVTPKAAPTVTVNAPLAAPRVTQVYVNGTDWTPAFRSQLAANGMGSTQFGYAVPGGNLQLIPLGWGNVNQISIRFDQPVSVEQDDLHVHGINVPDYQFSGFSYDALTNTATWTLASSFNTDKVLLDLNGEGSAATTIYDSEGFEHPRFVPGKLAGSDAGTGRGPWLHTDNAGYGVVQNGIPTAAGAQAVEIHRELSDQRWAVKKTVTNPAAPISVEWDMYVTQTTLPSGSFGPYFAVEAYDDFGNAPLLAGSAGVDAATGEILYQAAGTGYITSTGQTVTFNAYHHFEMVLNYADDTYDVYVDNILRAADIGFVDAGVNDFTDAPIASLAAGADSASQQATGTAYFDNYRIANDNTNAAYYDSGGFEFPRFARASLEGSDFPNGPWVYQGAVGYGVIQNTGPVAGGSQAVEIFRDDADERWSVKKTVAAPAAPITVEWDMYVTQTTLPSGSFGPYFAVEAYDELGNAPRLAGSAGVDAATGEVLYQAAGTGFLTPTGQTVTFNAYHHFEMVLNYQTDTYSVYVDGNLQAANIGFVDAGVDDFTDAPIAALAAAPDLASQRANGLAYFDNYRIEMADTLVNAGGIELDGEWFNGLKQYPSGDGAPGGAFLFQLNIAPGDTNGDGTIDFSDLVTVAQRYNQASFMPYQGDFTGDNLTDFNDLVVLAQHYNTSLPEGYPDTMAPSAALSQSVFSTTPIKKKTAGVDRSLFKPTTVKSPPAAASRPALAVARR